MSQQTHSRNSTVFWVTAAVAAAIGVAPISALGLALFELVPLHVTAPGLVATIPILVIVAFLTPALGRAIWVGFSVGVVACLIYDLVRWSLMGAIGWEDFIPVIGQLALDDPNAAPGWGYLYRYIGDGGGLGIAFAVIFLSLQQLGQRPRFWHGTIYGVFICLLLFGTILLAPHARETLFALTPLTGAIALIGHCVYGSILGAGTSLGLRDPRQPRLRRPGTRRASLPSVQAPSSYVQTPLKEAEHS